MALALITFTGRPSLLSAVNREVMANSRLSMLTGCTNPSRNTFRLLTFSTSYAVTHSRLVGVAEHFVSLAVMKMLPYVRTSPHSLAHRTIALEIRYRTRGSFLVKMERLAILSTFIESACIRGP